MSKRHHINLLHGLRPERQRRRGRWAWWVGGAVVALGGAYGGLLLAGMFAVNHHLTDVPGVIDQHNREFQVLANTPLPTVDLSTLHLPDVLNRDEAEIAARTAIRECQIASILAAYPTNGAAIRAAQSIGASESVLAKMIFAIELRTNNNSPLRAAIDSCTHDPATTYYGPSGNQDINIFPWATTEEWGVVTAAEIKDAPTLKQAALTANVDPRMLLSVSLVEQLRLYFTEREVYEKIFRPLKILGSATQFAWGVMAIKEQTAIATEQHVRDAASPYYLGSASAHLLDFTSGDQNTERFQRLTDEHNHYFAYLYGGLELAQLSAQWSRGGFAINDRPEILATLFNIGYTHSRPHANPDVGGSTITIAGTNYTFGSLAFELYYSGQLQELYPFSGTTNHP